MKMRYETATLKSEILCRQVADLQSLLRASVSKEPPCTKSNSAVRFPEHGRADEPRLVHWLPCGEDFPLKRFAALPPNLPKAWLKGGGLMLRSPGAGQNERMEPEVIPNDFRPLSLGFGQRS